MLSFIMTAITITVTQQLRVCGFQQHTLSQLQQKQNTNTEYMFIQYGRLQHGIWQQEFRN